MKNAHTKSKTSYDAFKFTQDILSGIGGGLILFADFGIYGSLIGAFIGGSVCGYSCYLDYKKEKMLFGFK